MNLSKLPTVDSSNVDNNYLNHVNKLRECWYNGQNAVVIDDQVASALKVPTVLLVKLQESHWNFFHATTHYY